ncbi:biliverdin-producing heme oxygenase [Actinomadura sp. WMMB 499]|uniref:biliverdin-producing heme oxygenase n=1 Tax=Actinomadura sp. WMMB 499 TaxID=1219491 RepID=UPI00159DC122
MTTTDPFTPDVVAAIARHMNDDHAADSVLIVRTLGGEPDAETAVMTGLDADGADFAVRTGGRDVAVRIPWSRRLTERAEVRTEVVRMYQDARRTAEPFSARLRAATRPDHDGTESTPYMTALLDGRLTRDQYGALIAQLHFVYDVLERAADHMRDDPVAGPFDLPGLRRLPGLEADLVHFHGPGWASRIEPDGATAAYCARLREVCFDWPGGFVAHGYTRYLGDLSGGQAIGARVARAYDLDADGVRFYRFDEKPKALKERYRALLDAAPWSPAEQDRVIDEVRTAYRLNADLAAALDRTLTET